MKKSIICFCVAQIAFLSISLGQPCDAILNHGIYDFRNTSSSGELASSFVSWYKNQNIRTFEDAKTASGNASIPIKSIIVGMGFNYDQKGFQDFQSYVEKYSEGQFSENTQFDETIKSINPTVVNAWEACIKNKGTHVWVEHTKNPNEFVLCANFVDDGGGGIPAKISSIDVGSGSISTSGNIFYSNGQVNTNTVLNNSIKAQIFNRNNDAPFTIVVNLSRGDRFQYSFSRIVKEKPIYPILDSNCNTTESTGYQFSIFQSGRSGNEDVQFLGMMKFTIEDNKVWCYYDSKMTGTNGNKSQASSEKCVVYSPKNSNEQILGFIRPNCDNKTAVRFDFASIDDGYTPIGIETKQIANLGRTVGRFYIKHTGNTRGVLYGSFYNNEVSKFLGIRVRR